MARIPFTTDELYEFGGVTELADWVLDDQTLPAGALALYARICYYAQQAAMGGNELTLNADWADWACGGGPGSGADAIHELVSRRALTKVASYPSGKTRFSTQGYSPQVQDVLDGKVSRKDSGIPVTV